MSVATTTKVYPQLRAARSGEPTMSVLEHAVRRGGIRKGAKAVTMLSAWAMAESKLGHDLGEGQSLAAAIREYAEYWNVSERNAWRELAAFREVFPEEQSPARIIAIAYESRTSRADEVQFARLGLAAA